MIKTIRLYVGLFLPSVILVTFGIVWVYTVANKIYDPGNYSNFLEMPLAQKHASLKLLFGAWMGIIVGVSVTCLSTYFDRPGKTWKSWWFWLWAIELGFTLNFLGGLPNSNFHLIPQKEIAIAWAPFRISFTACFFIGLGLAIAVLLITKMNTKRNSISEVD